MSTKADTQNVFEIIQSDDFESWLRDLRDANAYLRILARIRHAALGNLGDWKFVRDGVSEMRVDIGPGYRIYFSRQGEVIIVLLCGGTKRTQDADIGRAVKIAQRWRN